ncbi:MAG TPA: hypothetical protein VEI83_00065 [Acidimicrobiales bacterium]|nr:hypothetical protein [Acidimicrobiales bacterium]
MSARLATHAEVDTGHGQCWVLPSGSSGVLDRLCVHPSIIDFAERALSTRDVRLYQAQASAKYSGPVDYEQPMHTDRNHSWLPALGTAPWSGQFAP